MLAKAVLTAAFLLAVSVRAEGIAGKVLQDHSGSPVPSADVRIHKIGMRELAADLETDGEGRFEAQGLPAGDYRIEIEKPNYVTATLSLRLSAQPARVTVRLVRLGVIAGSVTNAAGQPVIGAMILAMSKSASGMRPLMRVAGNYSNLDDNGRFRLYNLAPGEYAVAVSYGASASAVGRTGNPPPATGIGSGLLLYPSNARPEFFTFSGGEEFRNVNFTVQTSTLSSVNGKVELPAPKTSFWVALTPVDQPSMAIAVTPAGEDGAFHLEGIPSGSYYVFAAGPVRGRGFMGALLGQDPLFARTRIEIAGQDTLGLVLTPQKGQSATVRLRLASGSESACPSSASVAFTNLEDWAAVGQQTVRASREKDATLHNLAPARYQVTAQELGDNCYQTGEPVLDLTAGDPGPIAIPLGAAGSIHGRVIAASPAEFAVVLLASQASAGAIRIATPDSEGGFTFASLRPGKYRIAAGSANLRWVADLAHMREIEVPSGIPAAVELTAPQAPQQ